MASSAGGSASFIGPSERLEVLVVQGAQASDPIALAEQDQTRLAGSLTGYQKVSRAAAMTIGGRHVVKVVYTWNAGASAVTGNAVELTTAR